MNPKNDKKPNEIERKKNEICEDYPMSVLLIQEETRQATAKDLKAKVFIVLEAFDRRHMRTTNHIDELIKDFNKIFEEMSE